MTTRLTIYKDKEDISDDVTLENQKKYPFVGGQSEIHYQGERIGWLESGEPMNFKDGYTFTLTEEL